MVAEMLRIDPERRQEFADLLQPEPLPDGSDPEVRVIVCGLTWDRYLALDRALGADRATPRFYFLDGDLELMTTSGEHERIKKWIGDFLAAYFRFKRIRVAPRGQATMRDKLKAAGVEPDESWCLGSNKELADLVLEIALTSGGLPKLEIYRRLRIPEVWLWRNSRLEMFALDSAGNYEQVTQSRLVPDLEIGFIEKCIAMPDWLDAMEFFQASLTNKT